MDNRDLAKEVIKSKGGVAKSADFVAAGLRAVDVVNMCNAGFLERVRHGYYSLAEKDVVSEERLLATLVPQGIVCVESALFYYGYSDFAPRKWSIAVPRTMSRAKLEVDRTVEYQGTTMSLTGLAKQLTGKKYAIAGPKFFKYKGVWLNDICDRLGV